MQHGSKVDKRERQWSCCRGLQRALLVGVSKAGNNVEVVLPGSVGVVVTGTDAVVIDDINVNRFLWTARLVFPSSRCCCDAAGATFVMVGRVEP